MPQSRFSKLKQMREKMNQAKNEVELPKKISDSCLGKCNIEMFGFDEENKPRIYCTGCGRNKGR